MVGATPPDGYGSAIVSSNNIMNDVVSPILPPLPPIPVDESPVQLDVSSLSMAAGTSCINPLGSASSNVNLRYHWVTLILSIHIKLLFYFTDRYSHAR